MHLLVSIALVFATFILSTQVNALDNSDHGDLGYSLGIILGERIQNDFGDLDAAAVLEGLSHSKNPKNWRLSRSVINELIRDAQSHARNDSGQILSTRKIHDLSYSLGIILGERIQNDFGDLDAAAVLEGLSHSKNPKNWRLSRSVINELVQDAQSRNRNEQAAQVEAMAEFNLVAGEAFLAENALKDGVIVTGSGLQYRVISEGRGDAPVVTDSVTVHYEGSLISGVVFDSSKARGKPVTFPLQGVIPGWAEGVQLMRPGAKFEFTIPSSLAYGVAGTGPIPPNSVLVFEVELLEVENGVASEQAIAKNDPSRDKQTSSELLVAENLRLKAEIDKLLEGPRENSQVKANDNQSPEIKILKQYSFEETGVLELMVSDNDQVAAVSINGRPVPFNESEVIRYREYLPIGGKTFHVEVVDRSGIKASETIQIERDLPMASANISFEELDPTPRPVKPNPDAVALIIGVSDYEKTTPALFADRDAQVFYDYAKFKLGISEDRIQILVNEKADIGGFLSSINKWLKRAVLRGRSDVYIFFAGHGLASTDQGLAYLIPYDGIPEFLDRTAISQHELFSEIASVDPRSVTIFLDTCYSGSTRGNSSLIAGRPLGIELNEQELPIEFTVISAAGGDEIAKSLDEAEHGIFSYFLMKGMEGGADLDGDEIITARELHTFVRQNVIHQTGGSQAPEIRGHLDRVLVRFN